MSLDKRPIWPAIETIYVCAGCENTWRVAGDSREPEEVRTGQRLIGGQFVCGVCVARALVFAAKASLCVKDARHPEEYCHRCGGPNRSWYASSYLWNKVMRPDGEASEKWGIVCPVCFMVLAEDAGIADGWFLDIATDAEDRAKAARVKAEQQAKAEARLAGLGYVVQPIEELG